MTEAEWLACTDPRKMLDFVGRQLSPRQIRLVGAAMCRIVWTQSKTPAFHRLVELAEQSADRAVSMSIIGNALNLLYQARKAAESNVESTFYYAAQDVAAPVLNIAAVLYVMERIWWYSDLPGETIHRLERSVLRDIAGDPFRSRPAVGAWPASVVGLAQALYDGLDNRLILADALEEANYLDLADHFRQDEWHPKGCWVVDLVLGKL